MLNYNFLGRFSKNTQIQNFMEIRPVAAQLFDADGQTDTMEPTVAVRNFANSPNRPRTFCTYSVFTI